VAESEQRGISLQVQPSLHRHHCTKGTTQRGEKRKDRGNEIENRNSFEIINKLQKKTNGVRIQNARNAAVS
jgi:hypothetical protein